MERLQNIQTAFKAKGVSCAFYDHYLYLALSLRQDIFAIGSLLRPIDDRRQFGQMFKEIASVLHLINYLKLNQKTGI